MDADFTTKDNKQRSQLIFNSTTDDVNNVDEHGNTPLHRAVKTYNDEMVIRLLRRNNIDVNCRNNEGETPLLLCIERWCNYILKCLIKAGADVNLANNYGQTPLHIKMLSYIEDGAHELIKCGANINAQDQSGATPLHYAVLRNSFHAVCLLLYYGADVSSISCKSSTGRFIAAICYPARKIAKALYEYYDEFSEERIPGFIILHFAARHESCFPDNLIDKSRRVQFILFNKKSLLEHGSSGCEEIQWFKSVWPMFNHRLVLTSDTSILHHLMDDLETCQNFGTDWVKFMYLILNYPLAFDLLQHYRKYYTRSSDGCFDKLIHAFPKLDVQLKDRVNIIYICLSLGCEIDDWDIYSAYAWYGFNDEIESFLFCTGYYCEPLDSSWRLLEFPQLCFIFSLESEPSSERIRELLKYQLDSYNNKFHPHCWTGCVCNGLLEMNLNCTLGFFALPSSTKQVLLDQNEHICKKVDPAKIAERIKSVPELPSLVELSRNKTRTFIRETYKINRAYQFDDILKLLNVPYSVRKILYFKTPIY